jgi:transcriptional regulator with XRE-family HTH domain
MQRDDAGAELARRLKRLRTDARMTQERLAELLDVKPPSISGWENQKLMPPVARIREYVQRLAPPGADRPALERELLILREAARSAKRGDVVLEHPVSGFWHFPDGGDVTIVCPQVPDDVLSGMPYTERDDPDYVRLYHFGDPDALLEVKVAIQGANPAANVDHVTSRELESRHTSTHLVVLGGVDWNSLTADLQARGLERVPIKQTSFLGPADTKTETAGFAVTGEPPSFHTAEMGLDGRSGRPVLESDVGLFVRGPNPYDGRRTLTLFNGMYSRGVLGAVRALSSKLFSERNTEFLREIAPHDQLVALLFRVQINKWTHEAMPPDWTDAKTLLYSWVQPG